MKIALLKVMMKQNKMAGFTLIELMIVVAIIGILAAIALPQIQQFASKAKQAEGITLVRGIFSAEISYFSSADSTNSFGLDGGNLSGYLAINNKIGFVPAQLPPRYYVNVAILKDDQAGNKDFFAVVNTNPPGIDTDPTLDVIGIQSQVGGLWGNDGTCFIYRQNPCPVGQPIFLQNDVIQ